MIACSSARIRVSVDTDEPVELRAIIPAYDGLADLRSATKVTKELLGAADDLEVGCRVEQLLGDLGRRANRQTIIGRDDRPQFRRRGIDVDLKPGLSPVELRATSGLRWSTSARRPRSPRSCCSTRQPTSRSSAAPSSSLVTLVAERIARPSRPRSPAGGRRGIDVDLKPGFRHRRNCAGDHPGP